MIKDEFDKTDEKNIGRPEFFRLDAYIEIIESFIRADEIQRAIWLCENPPAWFREHYPPELTEIKKTLYRQCYDIFTYSSDEDEASQAKETAESQWLGPYCQPRAEIISAEIKRRNDGGCVPWIFDLSCSHGNCPAGLKKMGLKFTYCGRSMNLRAQQKIEEWLGSTWQDLPFDDQPRYLICTEALEHAWDPGDIVRAAYKTGIEFDQVFLSTPLGTLYHGLPNWRERPLGHINAWTPNEFMTWADKNWPGYSWTFYRAPSMVLHGVRGK